MSGYSGIGQRTAKQVTELAKKAKEVVAEHDDQEEFYAAGVLATLDWLENTHGEHPFDKSYTKRAGHHAH